jgi:hypothetical protein
MLPLPELSRLCLALLFYLGGFNNILMWSQIRLLVKQKLSALVPKPLPQWVADLLAASASGAQLVSSPVASIARVLLR